MKGLASINLQGDASQAWMMSGMVAVYDMCYDAMTEAERAKIERAIIDKGLKPLCNDLDPTSIHNGKLMMAGAVLSGCAVIMNEDNIDEIIPYLDGGDSALWIVIAVIVVLLAGAAAGVVLFLKKRKAAN